MSEPIPPNPPIGEDDGPPVEQNPDEPITPVDDFVGWNESDVVGERVKVEFSPVIAGDPAGARVVVAQDGLHAYNAANVETATIRGEEGVFVGGEFRTSDDLPGQVTLADDAYIDDIGDTYPGIRVAPSSPDNPARPAGIAPTASGLVITGGTDSGGTRTVVLADPTGAAMRVNSPDGSAAQAAASFKEATLITLDPTEGRGVVRSTPSFVDLYVNGPGGKERGSVWASTAGAGVQMRDADKPGMITGSIVAGPGSAEIASWPDAARRRALIVDQDGVRLDSGGVTYDLLALFDRLDQLEARVAALEA